MDTIIELHRIREKAVQIRLKDVFFNFFLSPVDHITKLSIQISNVNLK